MRTYLLNRVGIGQEVDDLESVLDDAHSQDLLESNEQTM
jgi:hypothetical protein